MKKYIKDYVIFFLITVLVFTIDQWTKRWAQNTLSTKKVIYSPPPCDEKGPVKKRERHFPSKEIIVIKGFWTFHYVENCAGAFGMFANHSEEFRRPFFTIFSIIALIFIIWMTTKLHQMSWLFKIGLPMILGGAIGNMFDRFTKTYVIDFIHWYVNGFHWPTFNIADVGITVGVGLIILDTFLHKENRRKEKR